MLTLTSECIQRCNLVLKIKNNSKSSVKFIRNLCISTTRFMSILVHSSACNCHLVGKLQNCFRISHSIESTMFKKLHNLLYYITKIIMKIQISYLEYILKLFFKYVKSSSAKSYEIIINFSRLKKHFKVTKNYTILICTLFEMYEYIYTFCLEVILMFSKMSL